MGDGAEPDEGGNVQRRLLVNTGDRRQAPAGASPLEGVLVIDKPKGVTSHDVVAVVRRVLRERRVGHTGTLDPMATGVLPLVVGRATRLARFLSSARKRYEATIALGVETDTYDAEGSPVAGARLADADAPLPGEATVRAALGRFSGTFAQVPPAFSAKKVGGVAAHRVARKGGAVELAPVEVTVHELALDGLDDDRVRVRLEVSSGFYVRSLAHDLGRALGCGAHLAALRRTASGEFDLSGAVPLDGLDAVVAAERGVPLSALLGWMPTVTLTEGGAVRAAHGNTLGPGDVEVADRPVEEARGPAIGVSGSYVRVLGPGGALLAIAEVGAGGSWPLHPCVVLA